MWDGGRRGGGIWRLEMVDNTLAEQETRLGALCLLLAQVGRKPKGAFNLSLLKSHSYLREGVRAKAYPKMGGV